MFDVAQPLIIKETAPHCRARPAGAILVRCGDQQSTLLAAFLKGCF
jgi:hypothetical protein